MTFKKKDTKVPVGYNLNFDKGTNRWRLRIKREGKWETAGRFETEEKAIAFANQSNRFKTQIAESKKPVEEKPKKVVKEPVVEEKKESPLEKVRKSVKKKPVVHTTSHVWKDTSDSDKTLKLPEGVSVDETKIQITDVQATPSFPMEAFVPLVKIEPVSNHKYEVTSIPQPQHVPFNLGTDILFLKMQSRVADLQKTAEETNQAVTQALVGLDLQVSQLDLQVTILDRNNKTAIGLTKEFDRLRDSLRAIVNERTEPMTKDIESLRAQIECVDQSANSAYGELQNRVAAETKLRREIELTLAKNRTVTACLCFGLALTWLGLFVFGAMV